MIRDELIAALDGARKSTDSNAELAAVLKRVGWEAVTAGNSVRVTSSGRTLFVTMIDSGKWKTSENKRDPNVDLTEYSAEAITTEALADRLDALKRGN